MTWRSTTIKLAASHCLRALDFYERREPYDRSVFAVGTAAHSVLEAVGKEARRRGSILTMDEQRDVAARECAALISDGRDFEGDREPPIAADLVHHGRDLAFEYMAEVPLSPRYDYELGLAVTRDFIPCPYGEGSWLGARIDALGTLGPSWFDEEPGGSVLEVIDYKSAWSAGDGELLTLQRRIQGVIAWAHRGEAHEVLRLTVVNFRLRRTFSTDVHPRSPEGENVLATWRRDIKDTIARFERKGPDGRRPASPGAVCYGCPYLMRCPDALAHMEAVHAASDPRVMATAYAVARAVSKRLAEPLKELSAEAPIAIEGGVVGTVAEEERQLAKDAPSRLAEAWIAKTRPATLEMALAQLPGLLTALGLGVRQAEKLAAHIHDKDHMDKRAALLAPLMRSKVVRSFGIHRNGEG